ncbi:MAG: GrpB family protein [Chitinophagales bacterium]
MIGVKRGTVRIESHSTEWTQLFSIERQLIQAIFKEKAIAIEHIGSTAISNLPAKPLIDIAILVNEVDALSEEYKSLIEKGYVERVGRLEGKLKVFAKQSEENIVSHHIHVIQKDEKDWEAKIKFRDSLLNDSELVNEYAQLKISLQEKYPNERLKYTEGKNEFIQKVINQI